MAIPQTLVKKGRAEVGGRMAKEEEGEVASFLS